MTGATGFVGQYVVQRLLVEGFDVIATSTDVEKARACSWFDSVDYIPLDLNKLNEDENYYNYFLEPDLLIHLAWQGLPNYKSSIHVEHNLPANYRFIKNMLLNGLSDITIIGTCFEYGMQEGELYEEMIVMPENSYARAKNELRLLVEHLRDNHPFSFKWARLFYMYGEGQNPNSLFSQLQVALDRGEEYFNMSPGDQLRDFLEIHKVAEYLVAIAAQSRVNGIINCCSGKPKQVKELVAELLKKAGKSIKLNLGFYPYSDLEPKNFWGNNEKLKTILLNEQPDKGI